MTRFLSFCRTLGFVHLILIGGAQRVSALTVNTLVDEQDGSVTDGDVSLRDAIALAPAGDTITFSVRGTIRLARGQLNINRSVTINAPNGEITIDASAADRTPTQTLADGIRGILIRNDIAAIRVTLFGLTIRGGDVAGDGGGILCTEDLTVNSCNILGCCCSGSGGAIHFSGGQLNIASGALGGNQARFGGGAVYIQQGTCSATNYFSNGNTANKGGAIYCAQNGSLKIARGYLNKNKAIGRPASGTSPAELPAGGAIYCSGGLDLSGPELFFEDNQAVPLDFPAETPPTSRSSGGAIAIVYGTGLRTVRIAGVQFNRNTARSGGAIASNALQPVFERCQFSSNLANTGGGINIAENSTVSVTSGTSFTGNGATTTNGRDAYNAGTLRIDSTSTVGNIAGPGTVIRN